MVLSIYMSTVEVVFCFDQVRHTVRNLGAALWVA